MTTKLWRIAERYLPSPAEKVARRIAETDEEVTNQQITRLSEGFVKGLVSAGL